MSAPEQNPRPQMTPSADPPAAEPSLRSRRGLDWFVFCVADIQTGFGPFVAVFLTTQKWTQLDIGLVLTISGLVSLVGQIPIGAMVDRVRSIRRTAIFALLAIGLSAILFAGWPDFAVVMGSRILHAAASCVLGLCLVSMSLGLVGAGGMSARLGRNAAFASAGTGVAALTMGALGYYVSSQAVFFMAAALVAPALYALTCIDAREIRLPARDEAADKRGWRETLRGVLGLAKNRPLLIFCACVVLFHLANAAMLPLAASMLTLRSSQAATVMVAAAMVVPQFTVTVLSPLVGIAAQKFGRRPLLIIGFAALAVRGVCFAWTSEPYLLVAIQVLDGVSAAVLGVLVPLTVSDLARGSHFNLAQGTVGCAMGIGASISTVLSGYVADSMGAYSAFVTLACVAGVGLVVVALVMPETRPGPERG
ncbi:MFS transporter [Azorhizobium oxalatiphilum]|uniref:MFS transporter n=1 Tax=Azorhizobium oxalatiphilum TaxID=980631 RepID=A0A917BQ89_9HYPH|nr:MFS transporter [Azorhizobium oxalatiphilum]GGF54749.1 MFS transporter [Azorhizobium oxalatiphilum]